MNGVYICPECRDGKHRNCNGAAWDSKKDCPTNCGCEHMEHGDGLS